MVLELEKTKTSQHNEIASLKRRVKKLEKRIRSRTHKLKRLYKVSLTTRVESSDDEESLGKNASKQGRIEAIDANEDITLVNDQDDADKDMFDVNRKEESTLQLKEKKRKGTNHQHKLNKEREKEKKNKPPTQAQQRKIMCTYLKNIEGYKLNDLKLKEFDSIKEMFDRAFRRVNTFVDYTTELVKGTEKRAGEELIQKSIKKQKVEDDKEKDEVKQLMETIPDEEEVAIDTIPLAIKSLRIVD
nr:hypothetical protein [Tanacetum cinerariifolium]